ncbi:MAG: hypothetical protein WCA10_03985, partial [Terracidiphilus sp.]
MARRWRGGANPGLVLEPERFVPRNCLLCLWPDASADCICRCFNVSSDEAADYAGRWSGGKPLRFFVAREEFTTCILTPFHSALRRFPLFAIQTPIGRLRIDDDQQEKEDDDGHHVKRPENP